MQKEIVALEEKIKGVNSALNLVSGSKKNNLLSFPEFIPSEKYTEEIGKMKD